jgi:hypothetical protein
LWAESTLNYPGLHVSPPVHENQLSKSNKLDAEAIWLYGNNTCSAPTNDHISRATAGDFPVEKSTIHSIFTLHRPRNAKACL